jgi:hypothetical protein
MQSGHHDHEVLHDTTAQVIWLGGMLIAAAAIALLFLISP